MKTNSLKKRQKKTGRLISLMGLVLLTIVAAPAYGQVFQISVPMNGAQEVPPVATPGTGLGTIIVNMATATISGTVSFSGLTSPTTAGHIHVAPAGVNGPVIIPMIEGLGVTEGTMLIPETPLFPEHMVALNNNQLYLNIHTTNNLGGEIRGQILFTSTLKLGSR
jgi:hypothetical protein